MMTLLILTWFPVVLVAGLGGRLLEHRRGHWLGVLCALFWFMLVQGSVGSLAKMNASTLVALLGGAVVIVVMGKWSSSYESPVKTRMTKEVENRNVTPQLEDHSSWSLLGEELFRFDTWLDDHRERSDIWDDFDEYVRSVLARLCHATHIRPYRTIDDATGLVPLRVPEVWDDVPVVSSTVGLPAQIMRSKSRYLKPSSASSDYAVRDQDAQSRGATWCFPVIRSGACIGVIEVGTIDASHSQQEKMLTCVERLIGQFWNTVYDAAVGAKLGQTDPVSGLLTREAFIQSAQRALKQSNDNNEPVAMVIVALERLRQLSDSGRWEVVDEIVRAASDVVRKKIRTDDCIGRFDESRIVVFLRRVDAELTTLVATQLVARLEEVVGNSQRWGGEVGIRCGVVTAGPDQTDVRTLLSSALSTWRSARIDGVSLVTRPDEVNIATEAAL